MQTALFRIPVLALILCSTAVGFEDSEATLQRFLKRIRADVDRLPNLVCTQELERFRRKTPEQPWGKWDTLRLEVAAIGDHELYARAGERTFQSKPLAELVGRGTVGTGQFANLVRQVFGSNAPRFEFKGETEQNGTPALEFTFDIAAERSGYKLRSGTAESLVPFQGSFWISASTLDLLSLEVQAYDIPDKLGVAQADTIVSYARVDIDGERILLPQLATLTVVATDGVSDMNRSRLGSCRQYKAESVMRFDTASGGDSETSTVPKAAEPLVSTEVPDRTIFEVTLESAIDPKAVALGDPICARLTNAIRAGNTVLIPQGARIMGRIVRLERQTMPFPTYEIGLELNTATSGDRTVPLVATMIDAGPSAGLIKQSRRLEPTFTRKPNAPRMEILVREVQQGQGILTWDARRGTVPVGLKMRWRLTRGPESVH